jgi:glycosyltransferase involved in cell wall biosynthesis
MRLLVLYEELAPYFLVCINRFAEKNSAVVHIVRKAVNKEAPFEFNQNNLKLYNREEYSIEELLNLVRSIEPDAIFCGGWSYKPYLKILAKKKKIPTIVGFDNKWTGSIKQNIARLIFPFKITNLFDYAFVPDNEQFVFAKNIGFRTNQIVKGAYSCDFNLFYNQYLNNLEAKKQQFPKRFIFVGRYYEFKGIRDLWTAFVELQNETPNEWELWCLGIGDIEPIKHDKIKHFGFVQPKDLPSFIKDTGVFVLPSHFEPWGVVVHEYAAAGFPIICSDEVGARLAFVENDVNGYIYKSGSVEELKIQLKRIMSLDNAALIEMGNKSVEKAKLNTPEIWADKLMKMIGIDNR